VPLYAIFTSFWNAWKRNSRFYSWSFTCKNLAVMRTRLPMGVRSSKSADDCEHCPFRKRIFTNQVIYRYFHCAPHQSPDLNLKFELHRSDCLTEYRTRKGLDLTFGGPSQSVTATLDSAPSSITSSTPGPSVAAGRGKETRGDILLRPIRKLGPNTKVISGPSLLVDQILLLSGEASVAEFVETKLAGDTCAFLPEANTDTDAPSVKLYFKHSQSRAHPGSLAGFFTGEESHSSGSKIYKSPRIGLDLSHPGATGPAVKPLHSRICFLPRRYRYFTHPSELVAHGRAQTFLGIVYSRMPFDVDKGLKDRAVTSNDHHNQFNPITTESLQQLLDFSRLSDEQCIKAHFDVVANALLRDFHLVLKCENVETEFQILELEFYLQKAGCHEDPYTHGGEEQKISGQMVSMVLVESN
jgi:hypothetical protein